MTEHRLLILINTRLYDKLLAKLSIFILLGIIRFPLIFAQFYSGNLHNSTFLYWHTGKTRPRTLRGPRAQDPQRTQNPMSTHDSMTTQDPSRTQVHKKTQDLMRTKDSMRTQDPRRGLNSLITQERPRNFLNFFDFQITCLSWRNLQLKADLFIIVECR